MATTTQHRQIDIVRLRTIREQPIGPGDTVRLRRQYATSQHRQWTNVVCFIPGIDGGVQLFDALEGSRGWNVEHLEVRRGRRFVALPTRSTTKRSAR